MKHIKQFLKFVNESLKDEIPLHISDIIKKRHSDKYLDMDVPEHNKLIPNVKVKIKNDYLATKTLDSLIYYFEDNIENEYFKSKMCTILKNDNLYTLLTKSLNSGFLLIENGIDFIDSLKKLYSKDFRLIDSKSTKDNIIFSNNKSNIYSFIKSYNNIFNNEIVYDIEKDKIFNGLRNVILNYDKNIEQLKNSKLYLYITDKPTDKLLMSVSNFYDSCQNIYNGSMNKSLLSNVFDTNSKIALLIFDMPYIDKTGFTVPYTSIARTIIRVSDENIMFDKTYPNNMQDEMYSIITEYTGLVNKGTAGNVYNYKNIAGLPKPYMDKYRLNTIYDESEISHTNPYAQALIKCLNVSNIDIEIVTDRCIKCGNSFYNILTHDKAMEGVRDYFSDIHNFLDYDGEQSINNALNLMWINLDYVIKAVNSYMSVKFKKDIGMSLTQQINELVKFLNKNDIKTINDLVFKIQSENIYRRFSLDIENYINKHPAGYNINEWQSRLRCKVFSKVNGFENEEEVNDIIYYIYSTYGIY